MAAPLSICTKEEQHSVIHFFVVWRCIRGRNSSKTFSTIWEQCLAATQCIRMDRKIKKWSHKCYAWRSRTHGHNWQQHWACTWHGYVRQLTTGEVANHLQISHGSAYEIIHNRLGFHKVCARWVPKQLKMLHKQTCLDICQQNSDHYDKVMPSWTESSLVMKHGSTIASRSVNGRVWNGNIHNHLSGKSSKANHQQEN